MVTPITYEQATKILSTGYNTIKQAAITGRLTQLPTTGRVHYVIEEQVRLFAGKPRISLACLSEDERKQWEEYSQIGEPVIINRIKEEAVLEELSKMSEATKDRMLAAIIVTGVAGFFQGTRLSPV